jgi:Family of unknown function (DUF5302)
MAESNSSQDAKSSGSTGSLGSGDETKRKFREALERKMAKSSGGSDHKDGGGKQSRAHGPVESRREFRRKSG